MKWLIHKKFAPYAFLCSVVLLFFWPVFVKGYVPFPGDLLLTQYAPWRHSSYGGYVAGSIPSKDQYFDVIRELYPWKTLVVRELKQGNIPLWNPYNFSGAPLLANVQSQVFYPLALVYLILPQVMAWTFMVISQPLLGSVFMYVFATEIGLSAGASVLAALLFNFSSFANIWMEFTTVWHTILWLPLLLYLIERAIKQKRMALWQQCLFVVSLFSSITGGHPQDFINSFLFLLLYTASRIYSEGTWTVREKIRFTVHPLIFIIVIPFSLAAPQLLPTVELFRNSARVSHDYAFILTNLIVQLWQLPLLVVADFFGNPATKSAVFGDYILKTVSVGITGFFFAIHSFASPFRSWHKKFFLISAVFILLLTVRNPLSELFYRFPIPILSTGTPTRILFLLMLSLSVLAGFGYDAIAGSKKFPFKTAVAAWLVIGLLWVVVRVHPDFGGKVLTPASISVMKRALLLSTGFLGAVTLLSVASFLRKKLLALTLLVCIVELFYGFTKFNPFVPKVFIFPKNDLIQFLQSQRGISRFWGYGTGQIEANFATQEYLYSPDGTDPLNLKWYNKFIQAGDSGHVAQVFTRSTRSDAKLLPGYGENELPSNLFRLRIMDMLGVKFVLDRLENPKNDYTFPPDRYRELWRKNEWTVYENMKTAPRYFVTSDIRPYTNDGDFEKKVFTDSFRPDKTVLLEESDYGKIGALAAGSASAELISYSPNRIHFRVVSPTRQLFYLSDTYDDGWEASINGNVTPVFRSNYAFRSIIVEPGTSQIMFVYKPNAFTNGARISIGAGLTMLLSGIYTWYSAKIRRHKHVKSRH